MQWLNRIYPKALRRFYSEQECIHVVYFWIENYLTGLRNWCDSLKLKQYSQKHYVWDVKYLAIPPSRTLRKRQEIYSSAFRPWEIPRHCLVSDQNRRSRYPLPWKQITWQLLQSSGSSGNVSFCGNAKPITIPNETHVSNYSLYIAPRSLVTVKGPIDNWL